MHTYLVQHYFFLPLPHMLAGIQNTTATRKTKQKTPACIREIQVHIHWTKVYSQQGLTAMSFHTKFPVCRSDSLTLCSLQNMFQMTPLALQACLQAACEVVNDTTVVLRKFWAHWADAGPSLEMNNVNGFSKTGLGQCRTITRDEQCEWFQQNRAGPMQDHR